MKKESEEKKIYQEKKLSIDNSTMNDDLQALKKQFKEYQALQLELRKRELVELLNSDVDIKTLINAFAEYLDAMPDDRQQVVMSAGKLFRMIE